MKTIFTPSLITAILLASGCAQRRMPKDAVILAANHAAEQAGYRLSDYKKPKLSFYTTPTNATWSLSYNPKVPFGSPGATQGVHGNICFWVAVDDTTGATKIVGGR